MSSEQSQPRRKSDGAALCALRAGLLSLVTAGSGCARPGDTETGAVPAAGVRAGRFEAPAPTLSGKTPPSAETVSPLPQGPVPFLGTDSTLITQGFDARARQNSLSSAASLKDFQRHFENDEFSEALATLETLLRDRPDDPSLLFLMAVTHRAAGHSIQAAPTLEHVIRLDPKHLHARKLLCIIWTEEGRCTEAEAQVNPLIEAGTADSEAWALRGAARLRCGDLAGAAEDAAHSLQMDARMHKALLLRCAVQMRQGQLEAARDDLVAARQAGAPESNWQPLSQELARKVADQQRKAGAASAP